MEDVIRRIVHSCWLGCIILSLVVAQSTLHAANQGELSSSSSRGAIKISLVIPEFTRLVADVDTTISLNDPKLCMHVIKRPNSTSANYYRVASLIDTPSLDYEVQLAELDKVTKLVQLDNSYHQDSTTKSICHYQSELAEKLKSKKNKTALLILIAE